MRKEDLREAFGKIKPRDALIDDTINAIRSGQRVNTRNEKNGFAFTYRLAGAMCAFAVLIGVGVTFGKDIVLRPSEDTPAAYERTAFNDVEVFRPATIPAGLEADAIIPAVTEQEPEDLSDKKSEAIAALEKKAESLGDGWSVVYGTVDGCYFVGEDCFAILSVEQICAGSSLESEESAIVIAPSFENDEEKQSLVDSIGGKVCALVIPAEADGETKYDVSEIKILK